jgi:hypothetical protein
MVYVVQSYWACFVLHPSSYMWKTKKYHNVSETGSASVLRWMGQDNPTQLGPLERASLNHWTETDPVSEKLWYFLSSTYKMMDKVQNKPNSSVSPTGPTVSLTLIRHIWTGPLDIKGGPVLAPAAHPHWFRYPHLPPELGFRDWVCSLRSARWPDAEKIPYVEYRSRGRRLYTFQALTYFKIFNRISQLRDMEYKTKLALASKVATDMNR